MRHSPVVTPLCRICSSNPNCSHYSRIKMQDSRVNSAAIRHPWSEPFVAKSRSFRLELLCSQRFRDASKFRSRCKLLREVVDFAARGRRSNRAPAQNCNRLRYAREFPIKLYYLLTVWHLFLPIFGVYRCTFSAFFPMVCRHLEDPAIWAPISFYW